MIPSICSSIAPSPQIWVYFCHVHIYDLRGLEILNSMHSKKDVPSKLANQLPIVLHVVKFCKLLVCNGIDCTLHCLDDSAYHGVKKLSDVGNNQCMSVWSSCIGFVDNTLSYGYSIFISLFIQLLASLN